MLKLQDIRHLHLELSSLCNARCPLCPRNLYGYPYNAGYAETNLELSLIRERFSPDFISQLTSGILINGNFGDFLLNPEADDIITYFREHNPTMPIVVSTNGSAKNADFWKKLGHLNSEIEFCLDGLEDTHKLYRQDTDWYKIIANAKVFMEAGGKAIWKMIKFDHNEHQIDQCKALAAESGFSKFILSDYGRNNGPVFNRDGIKSHIIGNGEPNFKNAFDAIGWMEKTNSMRYPNFDSTIYPLCISKTRSSIYISSEGKVYPCCWLGMNPQTYNKGFLGMVNKHTVPYMKNSDLHDHTLEQCLEWFLDVEKSWDIPSYRNGRIPQCDINCNSCKRSQRPRNEQVL
jgi:MoaA/NifB/PqqE/SkfB family radical SAM enzyme